MACSVASLSQCPGHQLPGFRSLRHGILACYLLGQGGPSTCVTRRPMLQYTPSPTPFLGDKRMGTPSKSFVAGHLLGTTMAATRTAPQSCRADMYRTGFRWRLNECRCGRRNPFYRRTVATRRQLACNVLRAQYILYEATGGRRRCSGCDRHSSPNVIMCIHMCVQMLL